MGSFIQCIKTEYNLDNEGITDDTDEVVENEKKEIETETEMDFSEKIHERAKSEAQINESYSSIMHYDENFLFNKGDTRDKRSISFFAQSSPKNIL